eukprot:gene13403-17971_t
MPLNGSENIYTDYNFFNYDCDLVLRILPNIGIGVYTGKLLTANQVIQNGIGIPVPIEVLYHSILINYAEGYNDTHCLLVLGHSMLYNHLSSNDHNSMAMIRKFPVDYGLDQNDHTSDMIYGKYKFYYDYDGFSHDISFEMNGFIEPGYQLFSFYGEGWFQDRNLHEYSVNELLNYDNQYIRISDNLKEPNHSNNNNNNRNNNNNLDNSSILPGCGTLLTYIKNNVLYAAKNMKRDTIIEVSRALLVPISYELLSHANTAFNEIVWWSNNNSILKYYDNDSIDQPLPYMEEMNYVLLLTVEDVKKDDELIVQLTIDGVSRKRYVNDEFSSHCLSAHNNNDIILIE